MQYQSFLLNGNWEMSYQRKAYQGMENPWNVSDMALSSKTAFVSNAIPGYWEDMTEIFTSLPFADDIKINPEFGGQRYPMTGRCPDMALPNVMGNFFYRRTFDFKPSGGEKTLYFEGVQNTVMVWLNDTYIGRHEGYSTPFELSVPENALKNGENTVVLSVSNDRLAGYGGYPISGLTSRAANEYTGGITGKVELRVYESPLRDVVIKVSEDVKTVSVEVIATQEAPITWKIRDGETVLKSGSATGNFMFDTEGLACWSPENPKLYTLITECKKGYIERKFGVRKLIADGPHFSLNGSPYYLRGICEHCYFPETIHPAHDLKYYRSIIRHIKKLGFNFIRFHTYIPEEEYMQAADELGVLVHVESPGNTTLTEWAEIVRFCRRHPSVVIYCCGNELQMDDNFIDHLEKCAAEVHAETDALFSPISALRGLEYNFIEPEQEQHLKQEPFKHHPPRFKRTSGFCDLYSSYAGGDHSYTSIKCDPAAEDAKSVVYHHKPRVSHEICIDGTYTDLSLKDRYKGTRVGRTEMFSSIEEHLAEKGLLKNAPLYFKNSCEWQRRVRKYCFEAVRRSEYIAGYDFLGPIDTHWHTFGYDVGMMNEFYELKPGESVRNVRMYNSETILLTDLARKRNFKSGEILSCKILCSSYHKAVLKNAVLDIRLTLNGDVIERQQAVIEEIQNGKVSEIYHLKMTLPTVQTPGAIKLCVALNGDVLYTENEWELYLFPEHIFSEQDILVSSGMTEQELIAALRAGKDVLLLGADPFASLPCTFKIALAGRCAGNLATVINDHPAIGDIPHEGFCGWQFAELFEGGRAVCFEDKRLPFHPIIEVVSTHKCVIRQAALFEFAAFDGRCVVCSFKFDSKDPAANYLKAQLINYMQSKAFTPTDVLSEEQLGALVHQEVTNVSGNTNFAVNPNDKTAVRNK